MIDVIVDGHSERWLRKGFPWVYPKELASSRPSAGSVVRVRARNGDVLGSGIADAGWIAVRVFRRDGGPIDEAFVRERVGRAAALRRAVVDAGTTAYRLVAGENDGLAGVRIDRWGAVAAIVYDAASLDLLTEPVLGVLKDEGVAGVVRGFRPDHRDAGAKAVPASALWGDVPESVEVAERGLRMAVRPLEAPDCGLYTDLRDLRAWLEPRWSGSTLLNLFAYTGVFSVAAVRGGALSATSVDRSDRALARARDNAALNRLDPDRFVWIADDVFRALDALRRRGARFDRVVLDPPAFSRSDEGVWAAERDWPRLVAAAARVTAADGWLVAVSNQGELSPHAFHGLVVDGLRKAERAGRLLHAAGQGPDHPAGSDFPEGRYLKALVWALS
jgi:23S rRNA (cytosine1962-C5)-methyltransferase